MENGRLAKISVFVALFIAFLSMCVTVKLHTDIENNLDILNYGVSQEAENYSEKTYTAKSVTQQAELQSAQPSESAGNTEETVAEMHSEAEKSGKVNPANGITASVSAESTKKNEQNAVKTTAAPKTTSPPVTEKATVLDSEFVFSKNSKKLHSRTCPNAAKIKEENRKTITADELQEYLDNGYEFCANCQGFTTAE